MRWRGLAKPRPPNTETPSTSLTLCFEAFGCPRMPSASVLFARRLPNLCAWLVGEESMSERRRAAAQLCEELLDDLELSRLPAPALVKKTSRLARFLDDWEVLEWLAHEVSGYADPATGVLTEASAKAARRSGREHFDEEAQESRYWHESMGPCRRESMLPERTWRHQLAPPSASPLQIGPSMSWPRRVTHRSVVS